MVGSAAIKQGRSANRKHTYLFFGQIKVGKCKHTLFHGLISGELRAEVYTLA